MLAIAFILSLATSTSLERDVVVWSGPASPELELALQDLTTTLSTMTGRSWTRVSAAKHGIALQRLPPSVPAFAGHTIEAYRVQGRGSDLRLESTDDHGLVLAIYDVLDRLGARWPAPGEAFAVIPARPEIRIEGSDAVIEPRFRMREFFGTGGLGAQTRVDARGELQAAWRDYQRRNRWGASEHISGHAGTTFAINHRAELEAHSDWRAMVAGVRAPWSTTLKLCASSTGATAAFVEDRVANLRALLLKDPSTFAVSAEPADGGGHCECDRCRALGGPSDRVFHLANAVAKAVRREVPGKWVSLYAYNEHVEVPRSALEPNIFVMLCPYGLHRTGLEPEELLDRWSKKVSRLGVYDYWAIPDWNRDLPGLDPRAMGQRIEQWHARRIEAFMLESSFSIGATGPALWAASRHFFGAPAAAGPEVDEWQRLVFGAGQKAMQPVLSEWAQGYIPSADTLGRAYEALDAALQATHDNPGSQRRIAVFVRYVEFLRLRFEVEAMGKDDPRREAKAKELLAWVLSIAPDLSIASFRIYKLLLRDEGPKSELARAFKLDDPSASGWGLVAYPSEEETLRRLRDARQRYPSRPLERMRFEGKATPIPRGAASAIRGQDRKIQLGGRTDVDLLAATSTTISITLSKPSNAPTRLTLLDERGKAVETHKLAGKSSAATLHLKGGQRYRLKIVDPRNMFEVRLPRVVQSSFAQFSSPYATPTLYFFVPPQTKRVVLEVPSVRPIAVLEPAGRTVFEAASGGYLDVPVGPGQAGRVWSIQGYHSWLPIRAISVPQAFSLDPEDLLVPEAALGRCGVSNEGCKSGH